MELIEGVRNKQELEKLQSWLIVMSFRILPLHEAISNLAWKLMTTHALSDGLETDDALIAASAMHYGLKLYTGNNKHFKNLGLDLISFCPQD
jgi:predicted nucleic acid-binding protein